MTVAIGMIGAGGIAQRHAANLHAHDDVTVAAVCDVVKASADALADEVGAEAYIDHAEAIAECDLDAVYITTPPGERVGIIEDTAREGMAIFCEKPLAVTVSDGRRIREVVEAADVPFMMGFCSRFAEPCRRLHALVADGDLGEPTMVFSQRAGSGVPDADNWRVDPAQACGVTVESSSHNIDLLRWLGGEVTSASGLTTNTTHPELDRFDDSVVATLSFGHDCIGFLQNTWVSAIEYLRHGVVGTEGAAVVEGDDWWRLDRLTYETAEDSGSLTFDEETATAMGYDAETEAFVRCVREDESPSVDVVDGLRALEVAHEIVG